MASQTAYHFGYELTSCYNCHGIEQEVGLSTVTFKSVSSMKSLQTFLPPGSMSMAVVASYTGDHYQQKESSPLGLGFLSKLNPDKKATKGEKLSSQCAKTY